MLGYRAALPAMLCGALLGACGSVTTAEPTPAPLPTAFVAVHPEDVDRVIPAPHAIASAGEPGAVATTSPPAKVGFTPAAPVEAAPSPSAATPGMRDPALLEVLLVDAINRVRTANGLSPYRHSPELSAAARAHSCDLAVHGAISHTSSDGRTLAERLAGSSPPWEWPSESIAAGFADPAAVVALWMDEPPDGWHRRNMLDPDQREVGAGYCFAADDPAGNYHYWTADFSRRGSTT